ncbi:MAG: hypothetical protein WD467_00585 [Candidatus Saccharimonadales bacterium]
MQRKYSLHALVLDAADELKGVNPKVVTIPMPNAVTIPMPKASDDCLAMAVGDAEHHCMRVLLIKGILQRITQSVSRRSVREGKSFDGSHTALLVKVLQ